VKLSGELAAFETRLGHRFADPALLVRALTHPSIVSDARPDNQRLEFLGDRVLGLVIAETLLAADETAAEGTLAPRLNALVRKETCADIAREIDLGAVLRLGRSETMSGGRRKTALLGDGMEAVIAAVYLDGGYTAAQALIRRLWGDRIETVDADARDAKTALLGDGMEAVIAAVYLDGGYTAAQALIRRLWGDRIETVDADARDAKTALQEWAQARGEAPPDYVEIAREGPDHAPRFTIEAQLSDGRKAAATATSKRQAEQLAARALLDRLS